jgi:hypothetical protein
MHDQRGIRWCSAKTCMMDLLTSTTEERPSLPWPRSLLVEL